MRLSSARLFLAGASLLLAQSCFADLKSGMAAYYAKDYAKAEAELRPLAELGDPDASYYLGEVYRVGYGNKDGFELELECAPGKLHGCE